MKPFMKSLWSGYSVCLIASAATTAYVIYRIKTRRFSNRARRTKSPRSSNKTRPSGAPNDRHIILPDSGDPKMAPHIEAEGNETEAHEPHIEAAQSNSGTDVDCKGLEVVEVKNDLHTSTLCLNQENPPIKTEERDNPDEIIPDQDDPHRVSDDDSDGSDYDDSNTESLASESKDYLSDPTDSESTDDDSYDSTEDDSSDDDLANYHLPWNLQSKEPQTSDNSFNTPDNKISEQVKEVEKQEVKGQLPWKYKYDSDWEVEDYYDDDEDDEDDPPIAVATKKTTPEPKSEHQEVPPRTELEPVPVLNEEDFTDPPDGETVLGRGAFGEVTLKYQHSAGRWVAYKKLHEGSQDDLILEAQGMQLLSNHPSFPTVYGVVIQDGHLALVTEFLGDELTSRPLPLTDALKGKRPLELSQGEWNDIAGDIVDGVWYMHRCNLLHHDIKTDNILLIEGATRWEARIIDLGQCKQSKDQLVVPLDANTTPHEEMMPSKLHWTTFSDVYGVGNVLLKIGQHRNVPSLEEGGLTLKKSVNLSKEASADDKYPQMEIVRFQLRNKSKKMLN